MSYLTSGQSNTAIGSYNLNNATSANNNVAIGTSNLAAITTGGANVAVGMSSLSNNLTGSSNIGIGFNSAYKIKGSRNTCIGGYSGQASADSSTYNQSTALGYNAIIAGNNQIVLGTALETVYVPNILMLAGTNITSVISTAIASAFTTFLSASNVFTGTNSFQTVSVRTAVYGSPIFTSTFITLIPSQFGLNQLIIMQQAANGYAYNVDLPHPNTCQGQVLMIFNQIGTAEMVRINGINNFLGRYPNTVEQFIPQPGGTYTFVSSYYNWIIM
jgi:hypothetical protein